MNKRHFQNQIKIKMPICLQALHENDATMIHIYLRISLSTSSCFFSNMLSVYSPVKHSVGTIKSTRTASKLKLRKFIISLASDRLVAGMEVIPESNKSANTGTFIAATRPAISLNTNIKPATILLFRREAVKFTKSAPKLWLAQRSPIREDVASV